jgi:putative ABC transport system permease protein
MDTLLADLRYSLRSLKKSPAFTLAAVLTLALGIGATTAVFSLVNALLLRPLPYRDSSRIMVLWESISGSGRGGVAYPNFLDWQRQNHAFENLAAWFSSELDVVGGGRAERILGEGVSADYFRLLDVNPSLGRVFSGEETTSPQPVALISHALWQSRFGSDSAVIGRTLDLNGTVFTVVGVMPRGFHGYSGKAEIWTPISTHDLIYPQVARFDFLHSRDVHWVHVLGRLKPGIDANTAAAEMQAIGDHLAASFPNENRDRSVALAAAQDDQVRNLRPALFALMAAVGFVLLTACANVSNLFLVRLSKRESEVAIRVALGATRGRLLRQLLSETGLIATLGCGLGLALFAAGRNLLISVLPLDLPTFAEISLDYRVLEFALASLAFTTLALTLSPLLQFRGRDVQSMMGSGSRSGESWRLRKLRSGLASFEVALAVLLTIGAGLMIKSLWHLQAVNPGFRADQLVTLRVDIPNSKYQGDRRLAVGERLAEHIRSMPGVEAAAATSVDPFVWAGMNRGFTLENQPEVANPQNVYYDEISPGYFQTMNIPLLGGRDFSANDDSRSSVVIVSKAFAKRYWPGENALGKRMKLGSRTYAAPWLTVVGIVDDAQIEDIHRDRSELAIFYSPLRRSEAVISLSLLVRTKVNAASMIPALREGIQRFDSDMPVYSTATLKERLAGEAAETRSYAALMTIFGGLALALALIGTYGVIAYSVTQRSHDIGVRMALGARQMDILRMVSVYGFRIAAAGLAIGLFVAFLLTRYMESLLFNVSVRDPLIFAGTSLLLALAALAASYLPARRAAKVDPMIALRYE